MKSRMLLAQLIRPMTTTNSCGHCDLLERQRKTKAPAAYMVRTNSGGDCDPLWRDTKTKAPAANLMRYICSHKTNNLVTLLRTDSTDTRKRPGPPQKHLRPQRYLQPMTMCYELSNKTTPYQPNVDMSNFNAGHIPLPHLKRKQSLWS